ncbi:MAG: PEP-CTERM sorting domain-containing protein [Planctomycetota bacterium]|jgi:hypothetical protein
MSRLNITSRLLVGLAFLIVAPSAVAESVPSVIEQFDPDLQRLEYTVINPSDSTVDDIVGLVIEIENSVTYLSTDNDWQYQPLTATKWGQEMYEQDTPHIEYPLKWSEFFGMSYPFGDAPAAGFYLTYSEVTPATEPPTYAFDSPGLAVSRGESLDGYFAHFEMPTSTYYLAHIGDAANDTFGSGGLSTISGEAIPEPSTFLLVSTAGICLFAFAWRRQRRS